MRAHPACAKQLEMSILHKTSCGRSCSGRKGSVWKPRGEHQIQRGEQQGHPKGAKQGTQRQERKNALLQGRWSRARCLVCIQAETSTEKWGCSWLGVNYCSKKAASWKTLPELSWTRIWRQHRLQSVIFKDLSAHSSINPNALVSCLLTSTKDWSTLMRAM